jgi:hypothetical protein
MAPRSVEILLRSTLVLISERRTLGWRAGPVARRLYLHTLRDSGPQENIAGQEVSRKGAKPQRRGGRLSGGIQTFPSPMAVVRRKSAPGVNCHDRCTTGVSRRICWPLLAQLCSWRLCVFA